MALAYDAKRVTRDVDAMFVPHGVVLDEARAVADELGLSPWWLNEQASVYVSGKDDPGRRRVFDHPGLRVMAASPEHIFAMKALAARARDVDDLRTLAALAKVATVDDAVRLCGAFYPDEVISPRAMAVIRELFE
ncbi:nucleotidyltransferase [Micromonospora sp. DR5-3]|uniref:nucleotidyltransferase n=2 Tax=unclassified Micromonospora TaxID=2617518 RepID=UPI0022320425|nr:nucleotidyltransferase [Micromonospora sp. DR5-3]MCW3817988.1 nucleotidyltransferase [Micromonospora sp. DR5-3]